jgi:NAD(P)-dependent dehydrogenase (short-subunit alcohol dehydrogenase family)
MSPTAPATGSADDRSPAHVAQKGWRIRVDLWRTFLRVGDRRPGALAEAAHVLGGCDLPLAASQRAYEVHVDAGDVRAVAAGGRIGYVGYMGRSVLVTGANSGIGLVTAMELAGAGYEVLGTARSAAKAEQIESAAGKRGLRVRGVVWDVGDADAAAGGFAEVARLTGGGPWAVVNNAGYAQAGAIEDVDDEAARAQLEINLVAPARVARLVLPSMRDRGGGRIVNVSSVAGRVSLPLMGWYCAAKHGLEAMTDALRIEVAQYGVQVTLVEPGGFGTGIWSSASYPATPATEEYARAYARARSGTTAGTRLMPDPVWVARTVRLVLSTPIPLARYVIGADAVASIIGERMTPTMLSDAIKALSTGLRRLPSLPPRPGRGRPADGTGNRRPD